MAYEVELQNIQKKFQYNEEVMNIVEKAFAGMAKYYDSYGYFNQVYDLFLNVRIVPYDIGISEFEEKENLMRIYSDKTEEHIKNQTIGEGGELLTKREGEHLTHTVIVRRFDGKVPIATVIHEFIHGLVTDSFVTEHDGKKCIRSGLSREYFDPAYTTHHSIEEGFTEYDTKMICELMNYEYKESYPKEVDYVSTLMSHPYARRILTRSRVEGKDYMSLVEDENFKNELRMFINNCEHIMVNLSEEEQKEKIELNKEYLKKVL